FNECLRVMAYDEFLQGTYLGIRMLDKLLRSKTRVYRHHANHIYVSDDIFEGGYRSMGIDSNPCLATQAVNLLQVAMQMRTGFNVYRNIGSSRLCKGFRITFRLYDHKMYVKRFLRVALHRLHDRKSE